MTESQSTKLPSHVKDIRLVEFGRLTVLEFDSVVKGRGAMWKCICKCGNVTSKRATSLQSHLTKSCGHCILTDEEVNQGVKLRIESRVSINTLTGCWEFPIAKGGRYGKLSVRNKSVSSHVAAYRAYHGDTRGLQVLHKCDNPPCCNPEHLFLGTQKENIADARQKGRFPNGERSGPAKLTQVQVVQIKAHLAEAKLSLRRIGELFGVSAGAVFGIKSGVNWFHSNNAPVCESLSGTDKCHG